MAGSRARIIDSIRQGKNEFSKKDICAHSGVSWGAMYKVVESLLEEGYVFCRSVESGRRGRPNVPICLNADAAFWCGIDLGASQSKLVFLDLDFKVLYSEKVPTPLYTNEEELFNFLSAFYANSRNAAGISDSKIKAIGLAVSGLVDSENNLLVSGGNWGLPRGSALKISKLADLTGHSVCSCTTAVAAVLAEYHLGRQAGVGNLVSIGIGVGVGSGVVANHSLLISHPDRPVGYIGHILIPGNERSCVCGWQGCLEAYSGGKSLEKIVLEKLPDRSDIRSAADLDRAASSDSAARKILDTAAYYNAIGVANMIQLYSPSAVIFSGGQIHRDGYLYTQTIAELGKLLPEQRRNCIFEISRLGEFQSALGAARMAFEKFI